MLYWLFKTPAAQRQMCEADLRRFQLRSRNQTTIPESESFVVRFGGIGIGVGIVVIGIGVGIGIVVIGIGVGIGIT